jgi:hypothetical protein
MSTPLPANTKKMAPKVKWSALVAALVGLLLPGIPTILADQSIVSGLPGWVMPLIGVITGGVLPALAGYLAPHQPRQGDSVPIPPSDPGLHGYGS